LAKKKHQPPSKIRYDNTHPVISIRVDQETKQQLDEIKRMSGKSVGDILREALEVQAASTKKAFTRGKNEGKAIYGVSFKCSGCGGTIWIDTPEIKKAATQIMEKYGWGHAECVGSPSQIELWGVPPSWK